MSSIKVRIAEHVVLFSSDSEKIMDYIYKKYGSVRMDDQVHIRPDLSLYIQDGYCDAFVDYNVDIVSNEEQIIYTRADYRIEADPDYGSARIFVYDDFALKHALVNVYSAFITHHQWGLLIHSSCVIDKANAYIFAGQSGAGKSTVAQLSMPRQLLSDEATIVKVDNNEIVVFNSPFRSDTEMPAIKGTYPLAAIQILYQSLHNKRSGIGKMDGVLQLLNRVFYWAHNREDTRKVLRMCKDVIDRVPIYELHFQKNNTFWEEIS